MDSQRFDEISRRLAGGTTRRGALAALAAAGLGLGAGFGAREAEAKNKKKRKRCDPACAAGQTCDTATRTCRCDNGGTVCGAACCAIGQTCQGGQCVAMPEPGQCAALGAMCKDTGIPCCDGLTCASGQGGQHDIACRVPAGGACATTTDCVYDSQCTGGVCVANERPRPDDGGDDGGDTRTCTVTGGTKTTAGGYTVHTFTATDTTVNDTLTIGPDCGTLSVEYLVVGAGAPGGDAKESFSGGGGGGGAVTTGTAAVPAGTVDVQVGVWGGTNALLSLSKFGAYEASGGAAGSSGKNGDGSGDGGGSGSQKLGGQAGIYGGGGGGAGATNHGLSGNNGPGANPSGDGAGGPGGAGETSGISGADTVYGKGGSGGSKGTQEVAGANGVNPGDGGGGAASISSSANWVFGGLGKPGIVIVRYKLP